MVREQREKLVKATCLIGEYIDIGYLYQYILICIHVKGKVLILLEFYSHNRIQFYGINK